MSVTRGPVQWVIIPLKKYAQFSGRASRAEYWWFNLAMLVIGLTFDLVDRALESEIGVLGALFN